MADTGYVNIHGKQYKTVAARVNDFRETYGDNWGLITEIVHADESVVRMKALIVNIADNNAIVATGHAEEYRDSSKINKTSALENAETSAIGRALAAFGLGGTEFASADEVARAINGKPEAPKSEPLNVDAALKAIRSAKDMATLKKFHEAAVKRATGDDVFALDAAYEVAKEVLEGSK